MEGNGIFAKTQHFLQAVIQKTHIQSWICGSAACNTQLQISVQWHLEYVTLEQQETSSIIA
jgi:hypothetical protein